MAVRYIARFERLFRVAGDIDIDKEDLRHYEAFLDTKVADLLQRACEVAQDSCRRLILARDLPITKGLKACMEEFGRLDQELALRPVLAQLGSRPQLVLDYDQEVYDVLPDVIGGMTVALARSFRVIDPDVKGVLTAHWLRVFQLFDLVW